jgi:hypothetical protein
MPNVRAFVTVPVAVLCLTLAGSTTPPQSAGCRDGTVELAALTGSWSPDWTVVGAKTEPTYVEHVRISRRGDRFSLEADANGAQFGRTELSVDDRGRITVLACPPGARCDARPTGFLATVLLVAAARRHPLTGRVPVLPYAGRWVACIPAELVWVDPDNSGTVDSPPVLDPCLDVLTGAVLAQRSRHNDRFTGPSLDEGTLVVRDRTSGASSTVRDHAPTTGAL